MLPRPSFRLPLWAAMVIVLGVWAVVSVVRRDFSVDSQEVLVLVLLLLVLAATAWSRHDRAIHERRARDENEGNDT